MLHVHMLFKLFHKREVLSMNFIVAFKTYKIMLIVYYS